MSAVEESLRPAAPPIPVLALRSREAAKALGVSERTLWSWTHSGEVPHIRRDGTILYPVDDLRRWLSEQAQKEGGDRR